MHHYTDWDRPEDALTARDNVMDLLGDGQYSAPIVHLAQLCADNSLTTFVYVFHSSSRTDLYPAWAAGVHGDDLVYILGEPFALHHSDSDDKEYSAAFSRSDKFLSEAVMTYWSNFIISG